MRQNEAQELLEKVYDIANDILDGKTFTRKVFFGETVELTYSLQNVTELLSEDLDKEMTKSIYHLDIEKIKSIRNHIRSIALSVAFDAIGSDEFDSLEDLREAASD